MILELVEEAVASGARQSKACEVINVSPRTLQRWRNAGVGDDMRRGPNSEPGNKLSKEERQKVLDIANSEEYRNKSPKQIVPILAENGDYVASESSFYRILKEAGQLKHREPSRPRTHHKPRELAATGPNQVYSWDITYLKSSICGMFFYLYLFVDIWSRKIVGWTVEDREDSEISSALIESICEKEDVDSTQLSLHADNGGPMKGATMAAKLIQLGVHASYSRPSVSDDNPFSESLFRTLKYRPWFPKRPFKDINEARDWVTAFVYWYNREHRHSAIGYVTPHQRHEGADKEVLKKRKRTYQQAQQRHPERWSRGTRAWDRVEVVTLNPSKNGEKADAAPKPTARDRKEPARAA